MANINWLSVSIPETSSTDMYVTQVMAKHWEIAQVMALLPRVNKTKAPQPTHTQISYKKAHNISTCTVR
jgi:hypothetical protein